MAVTAIALTALTVRIRGTWQRVAAGSRIPVLGNEVAYRQGLMRHVKEKHL